MSDKYFGDVVYDVWRDGGDVDAIDPDRVDWNRANGVSAEDAAHLELMNQRRWRHPRDVREMDDEV